MEGKAVGATTAAVSTATRHSTAQRHTTKYILAKHQTSMTMTSTTTTKSTTKRNNLISSLSHSTTVDAPPHPSFRGSTPTVRSMTLVWGRVLRAWLLMGVVAGVSAIPWHRDGAREKRELINDETQHYLMKYGYLPMSDMETGNLRTEAQLRDAIRMMQRWGHVPITGVLDDATRELLRKPRCSLPDVPPDISRSSPLTIRRNKRFVKQGNRWDHLNVTWGIRTYPSKVRDRSGDVKQLSRWEIAEEIHMATKVWGSASRLEFSQLTNNPERADIVIDFKSGYHGDGYPFDGPGRTLAHAFYPGTDIGGDMHFDDEELWIQHKNSNNSWERVSLFITAAHELGHALGLYHSDVAGALMSPYLINFPLDFQLPEDDVRGIQEIYGADENWQERPRPPTPTTPPTTRSPPTKRGPVTKKPIRPPKKVKPDTCDTSYDAISLIRREIYIFKDRYFWRLDAKGSLKPNYPAEITRFWSMLPKNLTRIDAVYERPHDSNIVFFIGQRYYVCHGNQDLVREGRLYELGLPKDLPKVDASFVWGHNGRTYIFADTMYWRFDEAVGHVELDYPRDLVLWSGIPYGVDAAFKYNGTTYFFKGRVFWEFDDLRMKVKPRSPALSAPFWLGCPNNIENPYYLGASVVGQAASPSSSIISLIFVFTCWSLLTFHHGVAIASYM